MSVAEALLNEPTETEVAMRRLLDRLERHPDFAGLEATIKRVQGIISNDKARIQSVVDAVVEDPGLTARLLRLINAAHYAGRGGGKITSVQRAVVIMGFDTVKQVALSLKLLDKLPTDRRGRVLREDFLRSLLGARLARELCNEKRCLEEAYVTTLFQNLGRMLVAAHLPDDALSVRDSVARHEWPLAHLENDAARRSFGLSYADIGAQVAKTWGWPEHMRLAMRRDSGPIRHIEVQIDSTDPLEANAESLRQKGWLANDLADLLLYVKPAKWGDHCHKMVGPTGTAAGLGVQHMMQALAQVRPELESLVDLVGLSVSHLNEWHRTDAVEGKEVEPRKGTARNHASAKKQASSLEPTAGSPPFQPNAEMLADLTLQISEALLQEATPGEVLKSTLSALVSGMGFRRGVLFLARPNQSHMRPVRVVGKALEPIQDRLWVVDPECGVDLFSRLCQTGKDTLIHNALAPEITDYLPAGFACTGQTTSFFVMPMVTSRRCVGMMYFDSDGHQPIVINDDIMKMLRTLRNQALISLR